jgi:hypothetical protein
MTGPLCVCAWDIGTLASVDASTRVSKAY